MEEEKEKVGSSASATGGSSEVLEQDFNKMGLIIKPGPFAFAGGIGIPDQLNYLKPLHNQAVECFNKVMRRLIIEPPTIVGEGNLNSSAHKVLSGSFLSLETIPPHSTNDPIKLQAIKKCEDGSSILTFECPEGGNDKILRRDFGDFLQITHCEGVIINEPGMVAAVGGIPDELKIKGGISFWFPYPTFMFPKMLPEDLMERWKVVYKVCKEATDKIGFRDAFIQAYQNAVVRSSSTCKQSEDDSEARNTDQQPMVEMNVIPSLVGHCKSPDGLVEAFGHDRGDFIEVQYKGVIINQPGLVAAVGGIPDELKINGASFSFPHPTIKVTKNLPEDHAERSKVVYEAYYKVFGNDFYKRSIIRAYKKAKLSRNSEQSEDGDKAHDKFQESLPMVEVNLDPRMLRRKSQKGQVRDGLMI